METPTQPHTTDVDKVTRRLYRGTSVINFRLSSTDTNNAISIIEAHVCRGTEPPIHVHDREDETFSIIEGEVTFFIGENIIKAYPGDIVFAPRGIAHKFRLDTETAKFQTIITPGAFDQFFWKQSTPYSAGEPIKPIGPPAPEAIEAGLRFANEFSVRFV